MHLDHYDTYYCGGLISNFPKTACTVRGICVWGNGSQNSVLTAIFNLFFFNSQFYQDLTFLYKEIFKFYFNSQKGGQITTTLLRLYTTLSVRG